MASPSHPSFSCGVAVRNEGADAGDGRDGAGGAGVPLPSRDALRADPAVYTACYCEENVLRLMAELGLSPKRCGIVYITNEGSGSSKKKETERGVLRVGRRR
jgi:hypothetical protein